MIYFDNAATTWPKPRSVIDGVCESLKHFAANPGRSGHRMAINAGQKVFETRELLSDFFGLDNPCNVIFTLNATHALNIVIKGLLSPGDHVICSQMDHNSVLRPVYSFGENVDVSVIKADTEGRIDVSHAKSLVKDNTKLIVMTHVSNVCGTIQPSKEISEIAHNHGAAFLLDASQSAGILDINMKRDNIDFLVAPGHKSLYGPMGTGVLCINSPLKLTPIMTGGTGSNSMELFQPEELPDRFECGTLNFPGICGLSKGVEFLTSLGTENIYKHEMKLTKFLINGITELKDFTLVGTKDLKNRLGVVSFVHKELPSTAVSEYLSSSFNIASRAMYHCAYPSHEALGTNKNGTVRISFGVFNTIGQVKTLLYALEHI